MHSRKAIVKIQAIAIVIVIIVASVIGVYYFSRLQQSPQQSSLVNQFMSKGGISPAAATFLAETKLELINANKTSYYFVATFPTNTTADIVVTLTPDRWYTPTQQELNATHDYPIYNVKTTHSTTENTYVSKLEYFLPYSILQLQFIESIKQHSLQTTTTKTENSAKISLAKLTSQNPIIRLVADNGGEEYGVAAAIETTIKATASEMASEIGEFLTEKGFGIKDAGPLTAGISSIMDITEALGTNAEYQASVQKLDQLQQLAENPTNPLTIKAYAEDPGYKQKILDAIADARAELKMNTAVEFLNLEIGVAAGLLGLPELSVVIAPFSDWSSETLKQLNKDLIKAIEDMIAGNLKGPINAIPATTNTDDTSNTGNTGSTGDNNTTNTDTWTITYEGLHKQTFEGGISTTITDKGTITIKILPDNTVEGTGNGYATYLNIAEGGSSKGEVSYSFPIGGLALNGQLVLQATGLTSPITFTITWTGDDGKKETSTMGVPGPMLLEGAIELRSGATLDKSQETPTVGGSIIDRRTMRIG